MLRCGAVPHCKTTFDFLAVIHSSPLRGHRPETILVFSVSANEKIKRRPREVAMTTVASIRNSEYETACAKCGEALIAPEWSEHVSERLVLNLWSCTKCGLRFETGACMPADAESINDIMTMEEIFPSLLVA
jgi:ribosomal protein L37AE/L43A